MRVKLSDIAKYSKGVQINGDDLIADGKYIYLNGGINPSGKWNTANVGGNTVTISEGGNSSGYINYITEPFWCGAHCYYLYDGPKNTKYLYYALKSQQERLFAIRSGACMPNIKKTDLGNFEFEYDFDEKRQNDIVDCLDSVQRIIESRRQELQKLDDLIKARFVEMFGDPVENNIGWKTISLDEACDGVGDGLHGTPEYDDDGEYPFINGNNLIDGSIEITPTTKHVNEETYKKHFIDIADNAILISINGTLGKLAFYKGEKVMLGKSACYCNLKAEIKREFVYEVMRSDAFARFLDENSTASTIKNVGLKSMRCFRLIMPPEDYQKSFIDFANQVDKSKVAVQKALDEAQLLFDSLMQQYFG